MYYSLKTVYRFELFLVNVAAVSTFMYLSQLPCRPPVLLNTDEALIFRRTVILLILLDCPFLKSQVRTG